MNIEVKMGEIAIAGAEDILTATGVGSCIVITLWDPLLKIGTLAHAMLSSQNKGQKKREEVLQHVKFVNPDNRYVHSATNEMLKKMESQGVKRENIEAKIIGGANMFSAFRSYIGSENVLSAKSKLKEEGIKIIGECIGGSQGRSVEFSISSGVVTVKTKF